MVRCYCNGGFQDTNQIGEVPGIGMVYYNKKSLAPYSHYPTLIRCTESRMILTKRKRSLYTVQIAETKSLLEAKAGVISTIHLMDKNHNL